MAWAQRYGIWKGDTENLLGMLWPGLRSMELGDTENLELLHNIPL